MAVEGEVEWRRLGASPGEAGGGGVPRGGADQPAESAADGEGDAPAAPRPRRAVPVHPGTPRTPQLPEAAVGDGTLWHLPMLGPGTLRVQAGGGGVRRCSAPLI